MSIFKKIKQKNENAEGVAHPLRLQLFEITACFICFGLLAIFLVNSQFTSVFYLVKQKNVLRETGEAIDKIVSQSDDFYNDMAIVEENNNVDVEIYNSSDRLVYDSAINNFMHDWVEGSGVDFYGGMRSRKMSVIKHVDNDDGSFFEIQRDLDTRRGFQYLVYCKTLDSGNVLKVYSQLDYIETTANSTTRSVSIIACTTFFLIILSLYFCVRHFTKPLIEMNKITRSMANMDFSQKCTTSSSNEIGELGRSINSLSASLDETLRDLQEKNKKLTADIERERKLEQMRKEFVSNASHELKTPIAIIQGYAEGIKLGVKSQAVNSEDYCDIIIEETHKMNRLVSEMLELSKIESGAYTLNRQNFNIKQFIDESIGTYGILAEENGITLSVEIPENLFGSGDPEKLEMVIHNFVSNAISHAGGEKKIDISLDEIEGSYRISVFNTGENIDPNELDSIWQSFYRADKAHSRAQGRYGLGLSIAKAIQDLHGMPYGVENVEGGVVFSFNIRKAS